MSLQELTKQAAKLSVGDRLALLRAILESLSPSEQLENWQYLVSRPHPWRKQLYIKGHKMLASTLWLDMVANDLSAEQAADNWDLPIAAIEEVMQYCQHHQDLLKLEAAEERYRLDLQGVSVESTSVA